MDTISDEMVERHRNVINDYSRGGKKQWEEAGRPGGEGVGELSDMQMSMSDHVVRVGVNRRDR